MEREILEFIGSHQFPGKVIFAKTWGSHSHNTHLETSDWDFSGVYIAPIHSIIGMNHVQETKENDKGSKPDFAFHEVGKFCDLLMKGNPGLIEMLFTERMVYRTAEWDELIAERQRFLSATAVNSYLGYAEGQLKRLRSGKSVHSTGGQYNEKWAYHLVRGLKDAFRIASGDVPVVWKEGDEHKLLMDIRNGVINQNEVEGIAANEVNKILDIKPWRLPEQGDREWLNAWLIDLRLKELK